MLSLCRQTDGRTDRRTTVKQYALNFSIRGHKNLECEFHPYLICQFRALPIQQQKYANMGIQLSDGVENTVGKGEIARYEQFLLFPQCFQKLSSVDVSN